MKIQSEVAYLKEDRDCKAVKVLYFIFIFNKIL
jgi:hypothetical protein